MDEEIERLVVSVRADTQGFARDVAAMGAELDGPLKAGMDRAGRALESSLARAVRTGKLGFEDLGRVAIGVLNAIAASAVKAGVRSILDQVGAVIRPGDAPGRAVGGPVGPGRAYVVGERGPELFVPTASGRIAPAATGGGGRDVRVNVTIAAPPGTDPGQALQRSSRQVARAVRRALES